jgi:hypothetical protein
VYPDDECIYIKQEIYDHMFLHTLKFEKSQDHSTLGFRGYGKLHKSAICEIPPITHPMPQRAKETIQHRQIPQPKWETPVFYRPPSTNRDTTKYTLILPL